MPRQMVTPITVDTFVLTTCLDGTRWDVAWSYFQFMRSQGQTPNLTQHFILLKMLACCPHPVSSDQEPTVLTWIDLAQNPEMQVTLAHDGPNRWVRLAAWAQTSQWASALDEIRPLLTSGDIGVSCMLALKNIIRQCLKNDQWDIVMELTSSPLFHQDIFPLREVGSKEIKELQEEVIKLAIKYCQKTHDFGKIEQLFEVMAKQDYFLPEPIVKALENFYSQQTAYTMRMVNVNHRGYCAFSKETLPEFVLSPDEFERFQERVVSKILINFQRFLDKSFDYNVVLDGLNISLTSVPGGNISNKSQQSRELFKVVKCCLQKGLKPLTIHRPIVKKYPCYDYLLETGYLQVFSQVSEDDPFMIVSTIVAGPDAYFVSNDTLRDHCFVMGDYEGRKVFSKWQLSRQMYHKVYKKNGQSIHDLSPPVTHCVNACKVIDNWYLPLLPEVPAKLIGSKFMLPPKKYLLISKS
eukprot:maker-scaffold78_size404448-snap-gene-3.26 protein:Tk10218 transcript:maker-scaffold78_size404448-snap-gene-3.26-mRNA-1 annotation:"mitochondrial ribonuclease p protein 3"